MVKHIPSIHEESRKKSSSWFSRHFYTYKLPHYTKSKWSFSYCLLIFPLPNQLICMDENLPQAIFFVEVPMLLQNCQKHQIPFSSSQLWSYHFSGLCIHAINNAIYMLYISIIILLNIWYFILWWLPQKIVCFGWLYYGSTILCNS